MRRPRPMPAARLRWARECARPLGKCRPSGRKPEARNRVGAERIIPPMSVIFLRCHAGDDFVGNAFHWRLYFEVTNCPAHRGSEQKADTAMGLRMVQEGFEAGIKDLQSKISSAWRKNNTAWQRMGPFLWSGFSLRFGQGFRVRTSNGRSVNVCCSPAVSWIVSSPSLPCMGNEPEICATVGNSKAWATSME